LRWVEFLCKYFSFVLIYLIIMMCTIVYDMLDCVEIVRNLIFKRHDLPCINIIYLFSI